MEGRALTKRFHCVLVPSVLVSVHYSKDHRRGHKVTKICIPGLPSQGISGCEPLPSLLSNHISNPDFPRACGPPLWTLPPLLSVLCLSRSFLFSQGHRCYWLIVHINSRWPHLNALHQQRPYYQVNLPSQMRVEEMDIAFWNSSTKIQIKTPIDLAWWR